MAWNYILNGHTPVVEKDLSAWGAWMETADRRVEFTQITPSISVSTVFLGINHQWDQNLPPLLFETMSFGEERETCVRYDTWEHAEKGHEIVVNALRMIYPPTTQGETDVNIE